MARQHDDLQRDAKIPYPRKSGPAGGDRSKPDGLSHDLSSPEEFGEGKRPKRGGDAKRHEGGFAEGDYGRGPTPYQRKHSGEYVDGHPLERHTGVAGRGGSGIIGMGDGFKGRTNDVEHPSSHEDFERLGADFGDGGGKD